MKIIEQVVREAVEIERPGQHYSRDGALHLSNTIKLVIIQKAHIGQLATEKLSTF